MVEKYEEFLQRLDSLEQSELLMNSKGLTPTQKLLDKVKEGNSFRSFFGDTVVFDLDTDVKDHIFGMIDFLYQNSAECFCEKIKKETLHVTLHDLSNSPNLCEIKNQMKLNEEKIYSILGKIPDTTIRMKTNFVINMVDVSLVLAVRPIDEENYNKLIKCYSIIDEVKKLEYKFTPHITLAYYNRNGFDQIAVEKLKGLVRKLNESRFDFQMNTKKLFYQHFTSMNDYENILGIK